MLRDAVETSEREFRDQNLTLASEPARITYFTLHQQFSFLWFLTTIRKDL